MISKTLGLLPRKLRRVADRSHLPAVFAEGLLVAILVCAAADSLHAQISGIPTDSSPTIDTDISSLIATGCGYDAWTGSARRNVVDFEVPGAVSEHGLKWERTYSSSSGGWSFAYTWSVANRPYYTTGPHIGFPDGRSQRAGETGTKERLFDTGNRGSGTTDVYLADGSIVEFDRYSATVGSQENYWVDYYTPLWLKDRHGRQTMLTWEQADANTDSGHIRLTNVRDPSGRWIQITYGYDQSCGMIGYVFMPTHVQGSDGHSVDYTWSPMTDPQTNTTVGVLTDVAYSDGTSTHYTYVAKPWGLNSDHKAIVLVSARDTHATGPMQNIYYDYNPNGRFQGQLAGEHYLNSNDSMGIMLSSLTSAITSNSGAQDTGATQTETRGDAATRRIRMDKLNSGKGPPFVSWKEDYMGKQEQYGYNANFFLNKVIDRRGNPTNFTLESVIGNPTRRTHPDGTHIDYTYSDSFYPYYLKTVANERQYTTTYNRADSAHPLMVSSINYPDGGLEAFTYNNFNQVLTHQLPSNRTDGSGRYKHYQYDPNGTGLLVAEWNPTTSSSPVSGDPKTTYTYYGPNDPVAGNAWIDRVKQKTPPANAQGLVNVEIYEYDRALDASGETTGAPVAGRGLVTKVSYPNDTHNGTMPAGTYKLFAYDKYGNKVWEENENHERTRYSYDDYKRVMQVTPPLPAGPTKNDYSPTEGDAVLCYRHTTSNPYFVTDPVNIITSNTYDPNWRKSSTTLGYGNAAPYSATTWFAYDEVGNQTEITDPRGSGIGDPNYTTNTAYDSRNRKISVTDPLSHVTSFAYEDNLNLTRITRADGSSETKHYDPMNRVDTDAMPKAGSPTAPSETIITTFVYNPSGSLQSVTVPQTASLSLTTTFEYDPADLKTKMTYPNNSDYQSWTYDNAKNLSSRRTVNGTTQSFTFDSRNRKMGMNWSNNADSATFDYDTAGRLITANNPNSSITRGYDTAGRLNLDRQNVGALGAKDVQYQIDVAGKPTELYLTTAGYDYIFGYDPMGRFSTISPNGSAASFQYSYDLASNETHRLNLLKNIDQDYGTPDALNRKQKREIKINGNRLSGAGSLEAYGYDVMNRLATIDREDGTRDAFTYYLNGELTNARYGLVNNANPTRNVDYTIDKSGNRTNVSDSGTNTNYSPNNLNQYTTVGGNNLGSGSEHEINSYQSANYTYINDERLQSVTLGGNTYTLGYDALGRCVKRTLGTTTTYYIYDGEKPIVEYTSGGVVTAKNLYGKEIDEILMRTDSTVPAAQQPYFYQDDHEGSVTHLIDNANTAVIERYRYDVFGKPTINGGALTSSAFNNRFMFTGREYAGTFGIYEYRARAYHPGLGRFMSEDPKGFDAGDYNLFRYCKNDPEDLTDPMGEDVNLDMFSHESWQNSANLKPFPGIAPQIYTIGAHGLVDGRHVVDGRGLERDSQAVSLTARGLANVMKGAGFQATPGMQVYLYVCYAGAGSHPIAQQLADRLGVRVWAPTNIFWSWKDAKGHTEMFVGPRKSDHPTLPNGQPNPAYHQPDTSKPGEFKHFDPPPVKVLGSNIPVPVVPPTKEEARGQ
jgi:RHS repeat-associated protein